MTNRCPHCKELIPSGTRYCTECGEKLPLWNRFVDVYFRTPMRLAVDVYSYVGPDLLGAALGMAAVAFHACMMLMSLVMLLSFVLMPRETMTFENIMGNVLGIGLLSTAWPVFVYKKVNRLEQKLMD